MQVVSAGVLSMDDLVIAVVLSKLFFVFLSFFFSFLYSAPSSGIYHRFALDKYFIIILIINPTVTLNATAIAAMGPT